MSALAILPLFALVLCFGALHARRCVSPPAPDWRDSLFIATALVALWVAVSTELLGYFQALRFTPVLIIWLLPILVSSAILVRAARGACRPHPPPLNFLALMSLALIGLVLLVTLSTALLAPPNNIDSLNYHLPRIVFWMQQHSLADFPTDYAPQLVMPGLLEYWGLNSMILGHGSAWAVNVFDWTSLVLLGLAGSGIAARLGGKRDIQILAMLLIVTIPMAYGMATTFKPELMEAMFIEILAYWLLGIFVERRCGAGRLALLAITFGLLALTQGTGYVYGLPLAVMTAIGLWRCAKWKSIGQVVFIGLTVILLNAGYYARNIKEFGDPFGPSAARHPSLQLINGAFTPAIVAENLLRDTASMAAGPSHLLNAALGKAIADIAKMLNLNLQDPRATQSIPGIAKPYDGVAFFPNNEYRISWPLQMFLIVLIPLGLWSHCNQRHRRRCWYFTLLPLGGLLTMAAVTRWQQQENHLLIAIPALLMPVSAVAMSATIWRYFRPVVAVSALLVLLPFALLFPRPLVGQQAIEFHSRLDLLVRQHTVSVRELRRLRAWMQRFQGQSLCIGLHRLILPPYAIESILLSTLRPRPKFTYFNASISVYGVPEVNPNLVISGPGPHLLIHRATGTTYTRIARFGALDVYAPRGLGGSAHILSGTSGSR
ncbi:MAG: hypothetical protein ACP5I8_08260 [Phycisphaerae bacterium]